MKTQLLAAAAALGILGAALSADAPAPAPGAPPVKPAPRCADCNKARMASMRGEVGYCEHCGILFARIQKDGLDKAKEALTKAGATDLQAKGPFLTAKVGKDQVEAAKKALAPFLVKPEPPPEPEPDK